MVSQQVCRLLGPRRGHQRSIHRPRGALHATDRPPGLLERDRERPARPDNTDQVQTAQTHCQVILTRARQRGTRTEPGKTDQAQTIQSETR